VIGQVAEIGVRTRPPEGVSLREVASRTWFERSVFVVCYLAQVDAQPPRRRGASLRLSPIRAPHHISPGELGRRGRRYRPLFAEPVRVELTARCLATRRFRGSDPRSPALKTRSWRSLDRIVTEHVDLGIVIVSLHVATGAAVGALTRSRIAALALGPPLHLACDRVPHEDIDDRRFEIRSGAFGMALLALSRGPLDPATLGAASASAPDLEHIFRRLRPGGRKLFHGRRGWHRSGGFRADVQLVLAGVIIGVLMKPPRWPPILST
jgi:hypothetical protein